MFQKQFLAEAGRMRHAIRGVGASLRLKGNTVVALGEVSLLSLFVLGIADVAQARGTGQKRQKESGSADTAAPKRQKRSGAAQSLHEDPVLRLREHIRKNGLPSGSYVQIENRQNEKWFMRIEKGNVIDADGDDPVLESALWCKTNNVRQLDPAYPRQKCEIKTIIAAGPYSKFKNMLENK